MIQRTRTILLSLLALVALGVGGLWLLRAREQPTAVAGPRPTPPEIPAPPTMLPSQGVLASLPPVEAGRLIRPPAVRGARILYARNAGGAGYYLLDPETGEETRLEPFPPDQGGGAPGATMRVSPTGERILYTLFNNMDPPEHMGIGSVWTMNPDGSDKRKSAGSDELSYPANAIWSPDGREIAFLRFPDPLAVYEGRADAESVELWVMNGDGSEQRKINQLPPIDDIYGTNNSIQWLLDDHIYIVTRFTLSGEWLRVNPRTGGVTRLMEGVQPWDVVISPDTRWIVAGGAMSEEKVAALGRQPLRLPAYPAWDRTGERVAFVQAPYPYGDQSGRGVGIWVHDLRTGQETLVASLDPNVAVQGGCLAWSPDGSMLLHEVNEGLYVFWVDSGVSRLVVPNPWAQDNLAGLAFMGWVPVVDQGEHPRSDDGR